VNKSLSYEAAEEDENSWIFQGKRDFPDEELRINNMAGHILKIFRARNKRDVT